MDGIPSIFNKYRLSVEKQIKAIVSDGRLAKISNGSATIYDMIKYHMGWIDESRNRANSQSTGKYLRATLTCLACESAGQDFRKALPAAAAIELIHNFSLVHDDIQDDDLFRRHKPTVWKIWGKPQAINVGNAMKTLAFCSVYMLDAASVEFSKQVEIFKAIDEGCLRMIEGQYLDISFETRDQVSIQDYLKMIEFKTSALIECALLIGALVALDPEKTAPFKRFGRALGMAFQVQDDILGIWGNDKKTGKPAGNDLRKRKKSLPVVFFLNNASQKQIECFKKIYLNEKMKDSDFHVLTGLLEEAGSLQYCRNLNSRFYIEATEQLKKLPVKNGMLSGFADITDFLVKRDF